MVGQLVESNGDRFCLRRNCTTLMFHARTVGELLPKIDQFLFP